MFHFTALAYLPMIRREGITMGEVPLENVPYEQKPHLPNLTREPDPKKQTCWNTRQTVFDKSRVRLTVDVDGLDVVSFRELAKQYRMRSKWIKLLSPASQHYNWFHSKTPIPPDRLSQTEIALSSPFDYSVLSHADLESLCAQIDEERENALKMDPKRGKVWPRNPERINTCWLLDNERFLEGNGGVYMSIPFSPEM